MLTYKVLVCNIRSDGTFDIPREYGLFQVLDITGNSSRQAKCIVRVLQ